MGKTLHLLVFGDSPRKLTLEASQETAMLKASPGMLLWCGLFTGWVSDGTCSRLFQPKPFFGCGGGNCSVRLIHSPSCAMEQIQTEILNTTLDTHSRLGVLVRFLSHFSSKQVNKGMKYLKYKNLGGDWVDFLLQYVYQIFNLKTLLNWMILNVKIKNVLNNLFYPPAVFYSLLFHSIFFYSFELIKI